MAQHMDLIQEYILEKIEKLVEEPGKDYLLQKWAAVLAAYTGAKK